MAPTLQTERLDLIPATREEALAQVAAMSPADKEHLSAEWLELLHRCDSNDPWVPGFSMMHRESGVTVGSCGFKGPPADGMVEIAYGVNDEHQGKGFATEAAEALVRFAFGDDRVRIVSAHTLPEANASGRVLTKCGFRCIGEDIDPEDGLVWRWEKHREAAA